MTNLKKKAVKTAVKIKPAPTKAERAAAAKTMKQASTPAPKAEAPTAPVTDAPVKANTSKYEIRKDVPLPPPTRPTGGGSMYPLALLAEAGDSFQVPHDVDADLYTTDAEYKKAVAESKRSIQNRLTGAVRRFKKSHPDVALIVRTLPDGVGVWRVEKTA